MYQGSNFFLGRDRTSYSSSNVMFSKKSKNFGVAIDEIQYESPYSMVPPNCRIDGFDLTHVRRLSFKA